MSTVDLAVIGWSILCAVGSTLTYFYMQERPRGHAQATGAEERGEVPEAQTRELTGQKKASTQRTHEDDNLTWVQAPEDTRQSEASFRHAIEDLAEATADAQLQAQRTEARAQRTIQASESALAQAREKVEQDRVAFQLALEQYQASHQRIVQQAVQEQIEALADITRNHVNNLSNVEVIGLDHERPPTVRAPYVSLPDASIMSGLQDAFSWGAARSENYLAELSKLPDYALPETFLDLGTSVKGLRIYEEPYDMLVEKLWDKQNISDLAAEVGRAVIRRTHVNDIHARDKEPA